MHTKNTPLDATPNDTYPLSWMLEKDRLSETRTDMAVIAANGRVIAFYEDYRSNPLADALRFMVECVNERAV